MAQNFARDRDETESLVYFSLETETRPRLSPISVGMDSIDDKLLHLGGHDQVNVTRGLVVHAELALWITDTLCRVHQIILSALVPTFI